MHVVRGGHQQRNANRFNAITPQAAQEFAAGQTRRNSETIEEVYKRLIGFYLPAPARYETLLNLKGDDNVQQSVIDAMTAFEKENPNAGVTLPKNAGVPTKIKRSQKLICAAQQNV